MSLRQKLLLVFSLTVVLAVAAVAWIVSLRTREAFAEADRRHTAALVEQFRHDFDARAEDVAARIDRLAASERLTQIGYDLARPNAMRRLTSPKRQILARDYQLDYLEILLPDGSIVSSAQWPARFGYKENVPLDSHSPSFLKKEDLSDGTNEIGLFALRAFAGLSRRCMCSGASGLITASSPTWRRRQILKCCSIRC